MKRSLLMITLVSMFALVFAAFSPSAVAAKGKKIKPCENSIVDTALAVNADSGEFSTLIAALAATNLVTTFDSCAKQFTVFAPTDAAFAKLGLNADNIATTFDKKTLRNILLYHVVRGKALYSGDVVSMDMIRMWKSGTVGVEVNDMGAFLLSNNDPAKILTVDVATSNGVIHIIDTVLLP